MKDLNTDMRIYQPMADLFGDTIVRRYDQQLGQGTAMSGF